MKVSLIFGIIVGLILVSILYDIGSSLLHTNEPHFHAAPLILCKNQWAGAALPPFGIWLCPANFHDDALRNHELDHWDEYKRFGTLGFYANYIYQWIRGRLRL